MARMIPAQIYSDTPSPGEMEIFQRLKDDPDTKDWIALHSLDIANHQKRLEGEVDFVIIVPKKGVLCLEVKASKTIKRDNGLWYYGRNATVDPRGPFKQSSQAMHSLRQQLLNEHELSGIPFWSAVIFPYLEFNIPTGEWHSWQVIDNRGFRRKPISALILNVLNRARQFLRTHRAMWFTDSRSEPTISQCKVLEQRFRPEFELYEPPRNRT